MIDSTPTNTYVITATTTSSFTQFLGNRAFAVNYVQGFPQGLSKHVSWFVRIKVLLCAVVKAITDTV